MRAGEGGLRLLFLSPSPPRLDARHGGARAFAELVLRLAERHDAALLSLRAFDELPVDDILRDRCALVEEVERPSPAGSLVRRKLRGARARLELLRSTPMWVSELSVAGFGARLRGLAEEWRPDLVQIDYAVMAQYRSALDGYAAPRVLVDPDPFVDSIGEGGHTKPTRGLVSQLDRRAWRRYGRQIVDDVQAVVVFTELDRRGLAALGGDTPIWRIPLATRVPERPLDPLGTERESILFVGSFIHPPNVDAAVRLATRVFPLVRAEHEHASLVIVGDKPPQAVRRLAGAGVVITGGVPEVTPYLDLAAVVAVPLRQGGGMRVKVLEALAAGKAIVASPLSVEGLDLTDEEHVLLARTDTEFAAAIGRLLDDEQSRGALAARARAWALEHLDWQASVDAYEHLYRSLLRQRRSGGDHGAGGTSF